MPPQIGEKQILLRKPHPSGMLPQIGNAPSNRGEINTPKETPSFWYAPETQGNAPSNRGEINTPEETPSFRNASRNSREKNTPEETPSFRNASRNSREKYSSHIVH